MFALTSAEYHFRFYMPLAEDVCSLKKERMAVKPAGFIW
jgi:hypothetical protein